MNGKHIGICFTEAEIKSLLSGRKKTHRFPVKSTEGHLISLEKLKSQIIEGDYSSFGVKPHDLLWVKETYHHDPSSNTTHYKATNDSVDAWTSPALMPKKHSRITLIIKRIVVSNLHDITDKGAVLEGMPTNAEAQQMAVDADMTWFQKSRVWFKTKWQLKYKDWYTNPLVYMVEFEVREININNI